MPNTQPPRGIESVARFAQHMLQTLNLPKNAQKRHWNSLSLNCLRENMTGEYVETSREIINLKQATTPNEKAQAARRLLEESVDLANTAMMLYDHAVDLLKQQEDNHA
mgnify:CR=1 FL=1